jgi:antitoxin component YwqK of YwqJK toxin-antitoxin module
MHFGRTINMKIKRKYIALTTILIICLFNHLAGQVITDTFFYNQNWQICEKPLAAYYRIGTLKIDSTFSWYYVGKVKDYTIQDSLIMEGEYNTDGLRNGVFKFYYPGGKLHVTGNYDNGNMTGNWQWNYPDGNEQAIINFQEDERHFTFVTYNNENGENLLNNGNGNFNMYFENTDFNGRTVTVDGSYKDGKKSGTWKYYGGKDNTGNDDLLFTEKYHDGKLIQWKEATFIEGNKIDSSYIQFNFTPLELSMTERAAYDNLFRSNGDSSTVQGLYDFIVNHRPTEIDIKHTQFDSAFALMLYILDTYRRKIDFIDKDIDDTIEFKVSDKSYLENISITGAGLTSEEKDFLYFLMKKFRNINMPGFDGVAIEGYHDIYMFTCNLSEYMPVEVRDNIHKDLFFLRIPKNKFIEVLNLEKKKIKQRMRDEYYYFHK